MNAQRNRSIVFWLAALALLWGVLAPAFAAHLAHQDKTWSEVCMSAGTRLVALDPGAPDAGAGKDKLFHPGMHCPACVAQVDPGLFGHPAGRPMLLDAAGERLLRPRRPAVPPAAVIRADHRSRAPPLAA